jgi:CheY-like chemotaxis protein
LRRTGLEILESLQSRDDTLDIPVVVVTLSDESKRAYDLGVFRFIQRPFMPDDVLRAVLAAEKESSTERILIIDDHEDSVRLLMGVLSENGTYRVFSASKRP